MNPFSSNSYEQEEIEQLQLIAEQLDACQHLLKANNSIKARLALIWLDNLNDTLMRRQCVRSLEGGAIIPDSLFGALERKGFIPRDKKKKILRYFEEKVDFLNTYTKGISDDMALVLKIGHHYRNLAYHLDNHNPNTIAVIANALFVASCSLLANYRSSFTIGGLPTEKTDWLTKYGVRGSPINFGDTEGKIATYYKRRVKITPSIASQILGLDITYRYKELKHLMKKDLPSLFSSKAGIDKILKWYEFHQRHEEKSKESEEYDRARFDAFSKPTKRNAFKFFQARQAYEAGYTRGIKAFKASTSHKTFDQIQRNVRSWKTITEMGKLLISYQKNDELLVKMERAFYAAAESWDEAVQRQIDIKRGK